jgi:spore germination protein YaaH
VETWIVLDSTSFRPTLFFRPLIATPRESSLSVVTSSQGGRYHPEVVRGIAESGDAVPSTARSIAALIAPASAGLILDFQEMAPEDLTLLANVSRAIADSARAKSVKQIAMVIPAGDSSAYPGATLARIADLLIVRLFGEHGIGTAAGPIVSPPWFARGLGVRAGQVGVTRIVAGLPADGILWSARDSTARRVSYAEAVQLAERASTSFVRDPASRNLHASSARDGWEIWLADHELIERLVTDGRRIGVTRFALFGLDGADPVLWQSLLKR